MNPYNRGFDPNNPYAYVPNPNTPPVRPIPNRPPHPSPCPDYAGYAGFISGQIYPNFPFNDSLVPSQLPLTQTVPETQPQNVAGSSSGKNPPAKRSHRRKTAEEKALAAANRQPLKWTPQEELALTKAWISESEKEQGGHINPAVTFGLFLARKVSLIRAFMYMVAQCLGAICGVGLVKALNKSLYNRYGGGANELAAGYNKGTGLGAEIIGTFVLVYTVFSATDPKRSARDSHVPVLAPLPIGFAVFMVHLATIPITGTGINPARSLGAAVIYGKEKAWDDQWIFWVGPFVGAAIAAFYHQFILRAGATFKALGSFRSSNTHV